MEDFENAMAEMLEVDSVSLEDELSSFEVWDSLTILSIIAYCDSEYKVALSADEINDSNSVGGLKELINGKL